MNGVGLRVDERHPGVVVLTMHDPARRNVLSPHLRKALLLACRQYASAHRGHRAVVLTGAAGAFSAGGDLSEMPPRSRRAAQERLAEIREVVELITTSSVPWVAAVDGPAAGVACGIAAACDHVVVDRGTRFLFPFTTIGLVPDGGALSTIADRVGRHRARHIFLRGRTVGGVEAQAVGLADELTEDGDVLTQAIAAATHLGAGALGSIALIKRFYAGPEQSLGAALAFEATHQVDRYFSSEFSEGRSAFLARRPPEFGTPDAGGVGNRYVPHDRRLQ